MDKISLAYVAIAAAGSPRLVQVGLPVADNSPVSPRFNGAGI